MMRSIAGFVFRRQRKIANIRTVLDALRLIQRQNVKRSLAVEHFIDVIFQQRANHQRGTVILCLS